MSTPTATPPAMPFGPIPEPIRLRQRQIKRRMFDAEVTTVALAGHMGIHPKYLSSILNTGIRRVAAPSETLAGIEAALDEIESASL